MNEYTYIEMLGRGSFGTVNLMRNNKNQNKYAVKMIDLSQTEILEKEVPEEAKIMKILCALKHKNIVQYIDSYFDGCILNIIMEFCEGGTLKDLIKDHKKNNKPFEEKEIYEIFGQLLLGIQYLHSSENKIIHRDLKPENIFIGTDGRVKIGDFGSAKESLKLLRTKRVGTICYSPPEYLSKDQSYDHRIDIFALGCILYELCTLKNPFLDYDKENESKLVKERIKNPNFIIAPIPEKYPKELMDLINTMLERDKNKRPYIKDLMENRFVSMILSNVRSTVTINKEISLDQHKKQINISPIGVFDEQKSNDQDYKGTSSAIDKTISVKSNDLKVLDKVMIEPQPIQMLPQHENPKNETKKVKPNLSKAIHIVPMRTEPPKTSKNQDLRHQALRLLKSIANKVTNTNAIWVEKPEASKQYPTFSILVKKWSRRDAVGGRGTKAIAYIILNDGRVYSAGPYEDISWVRVNEDITEDINQQLNQLGLTSVEGVIFMQ